MLRAAQRAPGARLGASTPVRRQARTRRGRQVTAPGAWQPSAVYRRRTRWANRLLDIAWGAIGFGLVGVFTGRTLGGVGMICCAMLLAWWVRGYLYRQRAIVEAHLAAIQALGVCGYVQQCGARYMGCELPAQHTTPHSPAVDVTVSYMAELEARGLPPQ